MTRRARDYILVGGTVREIKMIVVFPNVYYECKVIDNNDANIYMRRRPLTVTTNVGANGDNILEPELFCIK